MPQVLETTQTQTFPRNETEIYYPSSRDDSEIIYPEQREDDRGETSIHITLIANFLNILKLFFKEREDVFLSGNMNLYYEEKNPNKWYAPDLLVAFGVPNHERSSYQVWKEEVFPQVVFEIASERTWKTDISEKLEIYGILGAEEYYILDPEFAFLPAPMLAFHRQGKRLLSVSVDNGKIFSPRLGLEIVRAENNFRLFNPQTNKFLLTLEELDVENQRIKQEAETEIERLKAEIERLKASN
ncbi:MAG TPA: Uma2 family endonuclease [Pyrinomonadaceae bacterium]|nr:Uma2 family endonuclease [Pyrinomonadaceae bacterium]